MSPNLIAGKQNNDKLIFVIYTLGYQGLAPARLREIVLALDAVLLDCRFKPVSRIPGFGHRQLEKLMSVENCGNGGEDREARYVRMGDMLGGHGHTTQSGIQALQPYADDRANCVLLCMEEHPADCHRHTSITGPHFPGALHIYRDRMFFSSELSRVEAGEIGFDELMSGSWDDWLKVLHAAT